LTTNIFTEYSEYLPDFSPQKPHFETFRCIVLGQNFDQFSPQFGFQRPVFGEKPQKLGMSGQFSRNGTACAMLDITKILGKRLFARWVLQLA